MPSTSSKKEKKSANSNKKSYKKFYAINKKSCVLLIRQTCGPPENPKLQVPGVSIWSHFPDKDSRHLIPSTKSKLMKKASVL